jgi:hypothetical protein
MSASPHEPHFDASRLQLPAGPGAALVAAQAHAQRTHALREAAASRVTGLSQVRASADLMAARMGTLGAASSIAADMGPRLANHPFSALARQAAASKLFGKDMPGAAAGHLAPSAVSALAMGKPTLGTHEMISPGWKPETMRAAQRAYEVMRPTRGPLDAFGATRFQAPAMPLLPTLPEPDPTIDMSDAVQEIQRTRTADRLAQKDLVRATLAVETILRESAASREHSEARATRLLWLTAASVCIAVASLLVAVLSMH